MGSPEQHLCTEPQSDRREGVKIPSLHKKVLYCPPSLFIRGPLGPHVPSATLSWQGSLSPPPRDASHSPTTGHNRHRVCPSASSSSMLGTPVPQPGSKCDTISLTKVCLIQVQKKRKLLRTHKKMTLTKSEGL